MSIKELRAQAREVGRDKKMAIALPFFGWMVLLYVLGIIPRLIFGTNVNIIVAIILGVLTLVLTLSGSYALVTRCLQIARKQETSSFFKEAFGSGIKNSLSVAWGLFKRLFPLFILMIVAMVLYFWGAFTYFGGLDQFLEIANGNIQLDDITINPNGAIIAGLGVLLSFVVNIVLTVKSHKYFLVTFLKHDYPDKKVKELLDKSGEMMDGNKAKAFVIPFTFLGWILLSVLISVVISSIMVMVLLNLDKAIITDIATIISYFITSFVMAYLLLTFAEFYLERNPLEIYNADYVKPETNPSKYIKLMALIICIMVSIPIILVAIGVSMFNQAASVATSSAMQMDTILQSIENK